jgi:hypothetical protein
LELVCELDHTRSDHVGDFGIVDMPNLRSGRREQKELHGSVKALITAAGLTVGFVAANLKPSGLPQPWIDAIRASIVSLVVCVVCAVTTPFALSILYDYSRSKQRNVHWSLLLCFALPEAISPSPSSSEASLI